MRQRKAIFAQKVFSYFMLFGQHSLSYFLLLADLVTFKPVWQYDQYCGDNSIHVQNRRI